MRAAAVYQPRPTPPDGCIDGSNRAGPCHRKECQNSDVTQFRAAAVVLREARAVDEIIRSTA